MNNKITKYVMAIMIALFGLTSSTGPAYAFTGEKFRLWQKVLAEYVNEEGRVGYVQLLDNREDLDALVDLIAQADLTTLTDVEQKAFWINAYNALTLRTVIDHYPVKDIRFVDFGFVWKKPKKVAQAKYSLGHIEHKILRPQGDPRIHFALNCASIGCPKLPRTPFDPKRLDEQLDFETRRFMNDSEKVYLDRNENILYHSELFNWFEEDYLVVAEDILEYIKGYLNDENKKYLEINEVVLKKIKYDWGLNAQK